MSMGGGVHVLGGAAAVLTRVTVTGCSGGNDKTGNHNRGGGVYIEDIATAVILTNVTISRNSLDVSGKGGGLNVDSGASVNASGLVVSQNAAFFAAGIFIGKDCSTNIDRAMITGNRADYGAGVGVFGGASPTITNSLISGNTASKWGGGLLVYTGAKASLQMVSFEKNTAELGGGAVAYSSSSFTATASKFVSNVATVSGGAIHLQTLATVDLVHTRLEANVATVGGGGAHVTSGASLSVTGGTLSGNTADQSGGGIFCQGGTYGGGNVSMTAGTAVTDNTCGTLGGGAHLTGGCFASFSDGVVFRGNSAGARAASASDTQCRKEGNAGGGAVAVEPHAASGRVTTLVSRGCAFTDNVAPDGGGVIITDACEGGGADCQKYGAEVRLDATVVSGNMAIGCQDPAAAAAAIAASTVAAAAAAAAATAPGGLISSSSSSSSGGSGGGGILSDSSGVSGSGCTSQEGQRRGSGGGIYAASGVVLLAAGTAVEDNVATASGGGIRCQGKASLTVTGQSTRVDGNVAGDTGGGIMHSGLRLRVTGGASFRGNRATDGGAVAIILPPSSSSSAAAAAATSAAFSDPAVSFEVKDNVTLADNLATRRGGAVYISALMARGNLSGIVLRNSTAAAGPGFYWVRAASPTTQLECRDCSLSSREAGGGAGFDETAAAAPWSSAVAPRSASGLYSSDHHEPRATEALSLSFDRALPPELQSGVTVPLFAVTLLDFYGRLASTEHGVPCQLEAVTLASAASAGAAAAASNVSSADDADDAGDAGIFTGGGGGAARGEAGGGLGTALEVSGVLTAESSAGIASFDRVTVRGRLGGGYTGRVKCYRGGVTGGDTTSSLSSTTYSVSASGSVTTTAAAAASYSNANDSTSTLSFTSDAGNIDEMLFPLKIAHCSPGQEPMVAYVNSEGVSIAKECATCKDRTFNFDGVACKSCPPGGECLGGDRLESRAGWWRSTDRSEVLFACPFASACRPGNATAEAACAPGYRGPVCGICQPGYRHWGSACQPCGETSTYALPLMGLLGFVAYIVYIFVTPVNDSANKACLFSSLIFIAQCLGLLKDYDVTLPSGIDRVIDTLNLANFNLAALAPGCADSDVNFYRNYLTAVAVPPAIAVVCSAVYLCAEIARRRHASSRVSSSSLPKSMDATLISSADNSSADDSKQDLLLRRAARCEEFKRRCVRNAAWLMVLAYSGVAKTTLQLYNARRLDVGSFLRRDYSTNATDDTYRVYAVTGYLVLVLYPIGLPLAIAWVLRGAARGRKLNDPDFKAKFGFLYGMYRPEYVAWELAGLLTKFVLAAIPVFATEHNLRRSVDGVSSERDYGAGGGFAAACQASLAQATCLALLVAVMWIKPHRSKLHSSQQATAAAVVLGWTLVLGGVLNSPVAASASGSYASSTSASPSGSGSSASNLEDNGGEAASADWGAGFTAEERASVCFTAAAATAAAAAAMISWSAVAGELDDFTARRASDTLQDMYRRVSMSFSKVYLYNVAKRHQGVVHGLIHHDDQHRGGGDEEAPGKKVNDETNASNVKKDESRRHLMSPTRNGIEIYSYEDQLRSLSSPPHLVVECEARPEDDLLKKDGLNDEATIQTRN